MKTPQNSFPELARAIGVPEVWLKREDLHHFGSHKGRSIPFMIDHYWHKEQKNNFVISSSGNAALAAALYTQHHNTNNPDKPITLTIFVGKKISDEKLKRLTAIPAFVQINLDYGEAMQDMHIKIQKVENPKQQAFQMEKDTGATLLRQSTNDLALKGYYELAEELNRIPNLSAIFIPTSSGTTALALARVFETLEQKPEIHIVQTSTVHPIADSFQFPPCPTHEMAHNTTLDESTESIANAIVDKVALRKFPVVEAVLKSHGNGWIASNNDIRAAIELVKKTTDVVISPNSALSVVGLNLALQAGKKYSGAVVCLITGA